MLICVTEYERVRSKYMFTEALFVRLSPFIEKCKSVEFYYTSQPEKQYWTSEVAVQRHLLRKRCLLSLIIIIYVRMFLFYKGKSL
jgi:hypothetical protein